MLGESSKMEEAQHSGDPLGEIPGESSGREGAVHSADPPREMPGESGRDEEAERNADPPDEMPGERSEERSSGALCGKEGEPLEGRAEEGGRGRDSPGEGRGASGRTFLPDSNAGYLRPEYWDERFQQEAQYEWFRPYSEFQDLLRPHLSPASRILVVGCGNSSLSLDLWRDGFRDVTSIDLSPVVIQRMRDKAAQIGASSTHWQVADMLDLPFEVASFDAVVEKGTMDVLFVDNDSSWDPRPEVRERVTRFLDGVHRVLTPSGVFLSITFSQPHFRRPLLLAPAYDWSLLCSPFGPPGGFHYFVYALTRGERTPQDTPVAFAGAGEVAAVGLSEGPMHSHMDAEDYLLAMDL